MPRVEAEPILEVAEQRYKEWDMSLAHLARHQKPYVPGNTPFQKYPMVLYRAQVRHTGERASILPEPRENYFKEHGQFSVALTDVLNWNRDCTTTVGNDAEYQRAMEMGYRE